MDRKSRDCYHLTKEKVEENRGEVVHERAKQQNSKTNTVQEETKVDMRDKTKNKNKTKT